MIETLEVHQFMNHHVVAHPVWHGDEAPIQADVPVTSAGSPPRPLIANADARDRQIMCVSQFSQPPGELCLRLRAESLPIVDGKAAARQRGSLPQDPLDVALREGIGLAA